MLPPPQKRVTKMAQVLGLKVLRAGSVLLLVPPLALALVLALVLVIVVLMVLVLVIVVLMVGLVVVLVVATPCFMVETRMMTTTWRGWTTVPLVTLRRRVRGRIPSHLRRRLWHPRLPLSSRARLLARRSPRCCNKRSVRHGVDPAAPNTCAG